MGSDGEEPLGRYEFNMSLLLILTVAFLAGAVISYGVVSLSAVNKAVILQNISKHQDLSYYSKVSNCTQGRGEVYAPNGSGMRLYVSNGEVVGVGSSWPANRGWFPWADQEKGKPLGAANFSYYTQSIFLRNMSEVTC